MEYHVAESQVNTVLMLSVAAVMPTISNLAGQCELDLGSELYRRLLITQTLRGNRKSFRSSGVQVTRSRKEMTVNMGKGVTMCFSFNSVCTLME